MRCMVTGGSGFIGSHVVEALLGAGHEVWVWDVIQSSKAPTIQRLLSSVNAEDLRGFDAVFHLAASADVTQFDGVSPIETNVLDTYRWLLTCADAGVKRFLLASTVWVYQATEAPLACPTAGLRPDLVRHPYAASKIAAETLTASVGALRGLPWTIMRYGIPYGPRMRPTPVIPVFLRRISERQPIKIAGDGLGGRNFLYVADLAGAHVKCLSHRAETKILNFEGARKVSLLELARVCGEELQIEPQIEFGPERPGDYAGAVVSTAETEETIGWKPHTTFREGLQRTVEWWTHA